MIRVEGVDVPRGAGVQGLTQWEITIAEALSRRGYATGLFGKWHLGSVKGRLPADQGFDEWYGITSSGAPATWTSMPGYDPNVAPVTHIMEGRRGEAARSLEQNVLFHVIAQSSDTIRGELCKLGGCDARGVPVKRPERAALLKAAGVAKSSM